MKIGINNIVGLSTRKT